MTIEQYEQECNSILAKARNEETTARVNGALGVAYRHLDRIQIGAMSLVPAVIREIEASISRARFIVDNPVIDLRGNPGDIRFQCPTCNWGVTLKPAGAAEWTQHGALIPQCRKCQIDLERTEFQ